MGNKQTLFTRRIAIVARADNVRRLAGTSHQYDHIRRNAKRFRLLFAAGEQFRALLSPGSIA